MSEPQVWMVRRSNSTFLKPMPKKELIRLIEIGQLRPDDEVCPSAGYWFYLHETAEVRKYFGEILMGKLFAHGKEDVTSETATAKTLGKTKKLLHIPAKKVYPKMALPEAPEPQFFLKAAIVILAGFSIYILYVISSWLRTY